MPWSLLSSGKVRIAIIDDQKMILRFTKKMLEKAYDAEVQTFQINSVHEFTSFQKLLKGSNRACDDWDIVIVDQVSIS